MLTIHSCLSSITQAYQAKLVLPSLTPYQKKITAIAVLALSLLSILSYCLMRKCGFRANQHNVGQQEVKKDKEEVELHFQGGDWGKHSHQYPYVTKLYVNDSIKTVLKHLAKLSSLEYLSLCFPPSFEKKVKMLTAKDFDTLKDCPSLQTLALTCRQGSTYLTQGVFQDLKDCASLERLELVGFKMHPTCFEDLKDCTSLKSVYLSDDANSVSDVHLSHLKNCASLTDLTLFFCKNLSAKTFEDLKDSSLQNLKLMYCELTDECLEHIKEMSSLRNLELMSHGFTEKGLKHLKTLSNLESLSLNISDFQDMGNMQKITDECFEDLKALPSLKLLRVGLCYLSEEHKKALKECHPLLEIETVS